jgi:hypothetical protein
VCIWNGWCVFSEGFFVKSLHWQRQNRKTEEKKDKEKKKQRDVEEKEGKTVLLLIWFFSMLST